jgi:hypothetical protein
VSTDASSTWADRTERAGSTGSPGSPGASGIPGRNGGDRATGAAARVIDIDPELLERSASAIRHGAEQATVHMDGEVACLDAEGVPELLETLTPDGPYAWAIMPQLGPDGTVMIPIATTREEIADCYRITRGRSNVLGFDPLLELHGAWYTFQEGISRSYVPATGAYGSTETIALFPVTSDRGITGELAWWKVPPEQLGTGHGAHPTGVLDPLDARRRAMQTHDRYLDLLRTGEVDRLGEVLDDAVQSAVRDYVDDTGTLVGLDGLAAHHDHLERFIGRFAIEEVLLLERVVQDWYVFAEVRMTGVERHPRSAGRRVAFNTSQILVPGADGRFVARIGHGTDIAPVRAEVTVSRPRA